MPTNTINQALEAIQLQANSIEQLQQYVDEHFEKIVQLILHCQGRLVISGIGKSAIIAQKIVATLNSTGTPSLYMHAADAIHGDLGMLLPTDLIMIISKSGNSPEIKTLVQQVKQRGNTLIGMVGNTESYLATESNFILNTTVQKEACPNNLAPTTSTTAQMVMGDAVAVCLLNLRGFSATDFAQHHPGGALGKKLFTKVLDITNTTQKPQVSIADNIQKVILEISSKRLGCTAVLQDQKIAGIITDGDLRRMLEKTQNFTQVIAQDIMNTNPKTIAPDAMATQAYELMQQYKISQLVVVDESGSYLGILHIHQLLEAGIN